MSDVKDDLGERWREEILRDVSCLPDIGSVPSTLIVMGDEARPILSNPQQKSIWIAVAEFGRGRIVVAGHNKYFSKINTIAGDENMEIRKLNENIKLWLTKNHGANGCQIKNLKNMTADLLPETKIILCNGVKNSKLNDWQIQRYIENGGSLLHTMCAWGWLQNNRPLSIHDLPLYSILDAVGIVYTNGYFRIPKAGLQICSSKASESHHVMHALENTHLDNCCKTLSQINDIPIGSLHGVMRKSGHKVHGVILEKGHECVPSEKYPVSSTVGKCVMYLHDVLKKTGKGHKKMPGIDLFPGDFDVDPPVVNGEMTIDSAIEACHPTGFYAKAGEKVLIKILDENAICQGWEIQSGCHTDQLHTSTAMKRWPILTEKVKIVKNEVRIETPFGGLLYVYSPKKRSKIRLQFYNVVEAPIFDLTRPETIRNWKTNRKAPGLWADICGQYIVFTLPAKSIRNLEDPTKVLETWDCVVRAHNHLLGSDPNTQHREWVVADLQPAGGYMHSGYPIVTHLDVADPTNPMFLLDMENLMNKGHWGMFHEFGHNKQKEPWTFRGTGEVTCNIFTLHAMDTICHIPTWIHPWLIQHLKKAKIYVKESMGFCKWQAEPGIALFVYAQVIHHFGWSVFKKTFRHYDNNGRTKELKSDGDKIDFWFHTVSKFAEYNLSPIADLWNIPLSCSCREQLTKFIAFLPDDEITQDVPEKIEILTEKYPGVIRKIRKPRDHFEVLGCCPRKWSVEINKM